VTTTTDLTVIDDGKDSEANWPKRSAVHASLLCAVVLGPAAVILGVNRVLDHPGDLGWWLAVYAAGFAALCTVLGIAAKVSGNRSNERMDAAVAAAEARGADDNEIFDLLLHAPPHPETSKRRDALTLAGFLAVAGIATWVLKYLTG
jgi:hypothetical protein